MNCISQADSKAIFSAMIRSIFFLFLLVLFWKISANSWWWKSTAPVLVYSKAKFVHMSFCELPIPLNLQNTFSASAACVSMLEHKDWNILSSLVRYILFFSHVWFSKWVRNCLPQVIFTCPHWKFVLTYNKFNKN